MSYGTISKIEWVDDGYFKVIFNKAEIHVFDVNLVVFVESDFEF